MTSSTTTWQNHILKSTKLDDQTQIALITTIHISGGTKLVKNKINPEKSEQEQKSTRQERKRRVRSDD